MQIMIVHFVVLFSAILVGEYIARKAKNTFVFLRLWMLIGIFLSISVLAGASSYWGLMFFSVIVAANFGFGIPACFGYFALTTPANNRGKFGGVIFLLIGLSVFLLSFLGNAELLTVVTVLTLWRTMGFLTLSYAKPVEEFNAPKSLPKKDLSYRQMLSNRTFLLYFVPWTIFLLINSTSFPINSVAFPALVSTGGEIELVLAGISAVIFGFFADSKGRKRLAVVGFAMLGVGYAILAFTAQELGFWIYTFIDGITWGIFVTIFLFSIWGDISEGKKSSKMYSIGIMPYLLSSLIRILTEGHLTTYVETVTFAAIFSFFSFFLFIAVLPLAIAPETMSEQIIRSNDLKSYIEKAKKQKTKTQKKQQEQTNDEEVQTAGEETEEYKKAKELAEKYY
jgi:MFS family permease